MDVIPYKPEHIKALKLQPAQLGFDALMTDPSYAEGLATLGPAYSVFANSELIACAGFWPQWDGRAIVWALVSQDAGRHFLAFHRAVERAFALHPYRRIETTVKTGFEEGARWAALLGMEKEATMRGYAPNGDDYDLYARITT